MNATDGSDPEVEALIAELQSLHNGDAAVSRLVAYGQRAIAPLRAFLLFGKPSGVYQPRQLAVEALAILGARDVLIEYLGAPKSQDDPVAGFGEEAVESTAARRLAAWRTDSTFAFLLSLAGERTLVGLIDAFGAFGREEALPFLERALEDDFYRPAAEEALRQFGPAARATLLRAVVKRSPEGDAETPSSARRRRSVARLLSEIGIAARDWPALRALLCDDDPEIVVAVAGLLPAGADTSDRRLGAQRLLQILPRVAWHLRDEAESSLLALAPEAGPLVAAEIARRIARPEEEQARDGVLRTLLRLKGSIAAMPASGRDS